MSEASDLVQRMSVASPCPASWSGMRGDDRVRFCKACSKNVYNISAMTSEGAADLIRRTEGSICIRLYRRGDGTVLTQDCPVGLAALRRKLAAAAAVLLGAVFGLAGPRLRDWRPIREALAWLRARAMRVQEIAVAEEERPLFRIALREASTWGPDATLGGLRTPDPAGRSLPEGRTAADDAATVFAPGSTDQFPAPGRGDSGTTWQGSYSGPEGHRGRVQGGVARGYYEPFDVMGGPTGRASRPEAVPGKYDTIGIGRW